MKTIHLTILLYCVLTFYCPAQSNLVLTNNVLINEWSTRQILTSFASVADSSNNVIMVDKELRADEPLFWLLHNTNSPNNGEALMPAYNSRFVFELKTTNGFLIPKTEWGKTMSQTPKSLTDIRTGYSRSVINGYWPYTFPALTNLFNFPSNGVYVFELRCWAWQSSQKRFALSDPIRVKVIAQTINATNSVADVKTNRLVK